MAAAGADFERFGDLHPAGGSARFAIATTITDNYLGLGATFLLSLKEKLELFSEIDVILIQDPRIAPLSQANRALIRAIVPKLVVLDVDASDWLAGDMLKRYDSQGRETRGKIDGRLRFKKAVYVKLNVLRLAAYEKVLLLDSDLLVLRDFSELFRLPVEIACVATGSRGRSFALGYSPAGEEAPPFNSGVLMMGKTCRGGDWFARAIATLEKRVDTELQDQSVFNRLFAEREILFLPKIYNWKLGDAEKQFTEGRVVKDAKIVHFIATSKTLLKDPRYAGTKLYDSFHAVQRRTGAPFAFET